MKPLTPVQNQALCLLAAGYPIETVAKSTGVTRQTINKWTKLPEFNRLLRESVAKTFDVAIAELVIGSREAAQELKRIITDPDVPSKTKVSAINVLLNNGARVKDSILEQRLERLEGTFDGTDTEQDTEIGSES